VCTMFPRCALRHRRLDVTLIHNARAEGKVRQKHIGPLGTVAWADPLDPVECAKFWGQFEARWQAVVCRHPHLTPEDRAKVMASVARYIPPPTDKAGA
jgi:hypothetical protein